jgi:1,5-anhydro-D-fructose reductase (1,5-anhydro-D-mannitol-forming)
MTIRLALLGTWHLHAEHHLAEARADESTEVLVVWDPRPNVARAFGEQHDLPYTDDLGTVLGRQDIDGVMVDTETTRHPQVIEAALAAGKHVFTEKVLATTTSDADALIAMAVKRRLALTVSFPRLSDPAVNTIARLIAEGELGTITGSRIRYAHHGAVGTPWIPAHFFSLADTGGGALIDLGAHPIYLSRLLHGRPAQSIHASVGHVTGREVEDNATVMLDYGQGVLGVFEVSMVASFFSYSIEISGTRGSAAIGPAGDSLMVRLGQEDIWREKPLDSPGPTPFVQFTRHVLAGGPDLEHLKVARDVTHLLEAAYESARTGRRSLTGRKEILPTASQELPTDS